MNIRTSEKTRPLPEPSEEPVSCNSWVCTAEDGRAIETYERKTAEQCLAAGWQVVTAYAHLVSLNTPN